MELKAIKSEIVRANDNLLEHIKNSLAANQAELKSGDIFVVSSKIVALTQGRVKKLNNPDDVEEFQKLVQSEADKYIPGEFINFTLKYNIIIPNAGIDRSNAEVGTVVLWPEDPQKAVDELRQQLMSEYGLSELGVMTIDSRCQPLRLGISGLSIAYSGFIGVEDNRGEPDLFGRPLTVTQEAKSDELAAAANIMMGEGNQAQPFVIIRNAPVKFTDEPQDAINAQYIPPEDCLFKSVFNF